MDQQLHRTNHMQLRPSKLGITAFITFMLYLLPILINLFSGKFITRLLSSTHSLSINALILGVFLLLIILTIVLSVIDISKPKRNKVLPIISLAVSCAITGLFFFCFVIILFLTPSSAGSPP